MKGNGTDTGQAFEFFFRVGITNEAINELDIDSQCFEGVIVFFDEAIHLGFPSRILCIGGIDDGSGFVSGIAEGEDFISHFTCIYFGRVFVGVGTWS